MDSYLSRMNKISRPKNESDLWSDVTGRQMTARLGRMKFSGKERLTFGKYPKFQSKVAVFLVRPPAALRKRYLPMDSRLDLSNGKVMEG